MGILDWLRGKDPVEKAGESVTTRAGKAAYKLAQEIQELEDDRKWKSLMDLYYKTGDPKAKVEILDVAGALAKVTDTTEWKLEVKAKTDQLKEHGYL